MEDRLTILLHSQTNSKEITTFLDNSKVNKQMEYFQIINSHNNNSKVDYFNNNHRKDKHNNKGAHHNKVRYLAIQPNKDKLSKVLYLVIHSSKVKEGSNNNSQVVFLLEIL